jgi:predicted RNase H-like HicB family nuclease
MSAKSRGSSERTKTVRARGLDRPFEPSTWQRAKEIAEQYRVVLTPDEELGWVGCAVELPNVYGDGETPDKCVAETRDALRAAVATMLEADQEPPAPAEQQKRTVQVNLRLTPDERLAFEEAARQLGFSNLSDYLRAAGAARGRLARGRREVPRVDKPSRPVTERTNRRPPVDGQRAQIPPPT